MKIFIEIAVCILEHLFLYPLACVIYYKWIVKLLPRINILFYYKINPFDFKSYNDFPNQIWHVFVKYWPVREVTFPTKGLTFRNLSPPIYLFTPVKICHSFRSRLVKILYVMDKILLFHKQHVTFWFISL